MARSAHHFGLILFGAAALALAPGAFGGKSKFPRSPESVPGQFVVQLKDARMLVERQTLERVLGGAIVSQIRPDVVLVQREIGEKRELAVRSLSSSEIVALAEPNFIYHALKTPNDSNYSALWGMNNTGLADKDGQRGLSGVDIGAEKAWDITTGSKDVVVAVIDTGVDFSIPDLTENAWTNLAEKNGKPGIDDDANGYVDDIHGYDFANDKGDSTDDHGHGSHCSGTIGGRGNDGAGVAGVSWSVSIMGVKFLDASGSGTLANAIRAIDYARKNGAKVMSNSWGGGGVSEILKKTIEDTKAADMLFVAAAGNEGGDNDTTPTYPASYPVDNIIAVAAVDNRGQLASFSNFGANTVHIGAPGVNILSTIPKGFDIYSGTSMATPHVVGVAALLLASNPHESYTIIKRKILSSARPTHALKGRVVSGGMLDAYYALTGLIPPQDPYDPSQWPTRVSFQLATPHPYINKASLSFSIKIPGAKRVSAHFLKFETENNFDRVTFTSGSGEVVGVWSGMHTNDFSPFADGDTLNLKFTSDESVNAYGFDVDQAAIE